MRRVVLLGLIIFSFLMPTAFFGSAHAVDVLNPVCQNADPNNLPTVCQDNKSNACPDPTVVCNDNPVFGPNGVLTKVINLLSLVTGIIAVFVIVIGGIKFITSSGDPAGVTSARNTILYAIIALVITMIAQVLVRFILSKL